MTRHQHAGSEGQMSEDALYRCTVIGADGAQCWGLSLHGAGGVKREGAGRTLWWWGLRL